VIKLSRRVLCLDWDKRTLRIVVARVGKGRAFLEDAHSHQLPDTVDADAPEAMGQFIRSMLARHRLRHRTVVVDVPRERAVINRLTLPPTPPIEVAAAVRFQAMKELPFPIDSAALDFVITQRDERGYATGVLLAAVTTETLDRMRSTCEAAGLTPTRIGLRPYANLISLRNTRGAAERRILFVDIGPTATEIDVMCGEALAFSRSANVSVPMPGVDLAGDEQRPTPVDSQVGPPESPEQALEAAVGELLVETTRTLQAYRASDPEAAIDEIVVGGGTGAEAQLAELLHRRFSLPVVLFDPTGALGVDPGQAPKLRSFSAALGLAWGLSREEVLAIDFLNPKRPISARERLRKRIRMVGVAAAATLVLVAGVLAQQYHQATVERDRLKAENRKLLAKVEKKIELANRIEEAQEWAVEAVWPDELLNVVQVISTLERQPGERLVVQEVTLDAVARSPGITLRNLFATDWQVPTELVKRLIELADGGERLYEAAQTAWSAITDAARFSGKADVRIVLKKLQEFQEQAAQRLKLRKDRLKEIGRS